MLQTNALNCLKTRELTVFTDVVNEADIEHGQYPLPEDHWINQPLKEEDGKTLLMVAIEQNLFDYIDVLLRAGASAQLVNPRLRKAPIHVAASKGEVRNFEILFRSKDNHPDINATLRNGKTALHICAEYGYEDCLSFLLQQKFIDVNVKDKRDNQTALYLAIKQGSEIMVKKLIEHGADLDTVCFGKSIKAHLKMNMPTFDITTVQIVKAPIAKQLSNSVGEELIAIMEKVALAQLDENDNSVKNRFNSLLLQMNKDEVNECTFGGYTLLQKSR